jgi:uncharacterized membrane protein
MRITVQLSAVSGAPVTVPFTIGGTATRGTDYTIAPESQVVIPAGATGGGITITVVPDALPEPNETVIVTMGDPVNATKGTTTVHTATINDDDQAHDVAVTGLTAAPNPVKAGSVVTFSYTVKNLGNGTERNIVFRLKYGERVISRPQTIPALEPGGETAGSVALTIPRRQRPGDYDITGEVQAVAGETNVDNNRKTVKLTVNK